MIVWRRRQEEVWIDCLVFGYCCSYCSYQYWISLLPSSVVSPESGLSPKVYSGSQLLLTRPCGSIRTNVTWCYYEIKNEPFCSSTQIYDCRKLGREFQESLQIFKAFTAGSYAMGVGPSKLGREAWLGQLAKNDSRIERMSRNKCSLLLTTSSRRSFDRFCGFWIAMLSETICKYAKAVLPSLDACAMWPTSQSTQLHRGCHSFSHASVSQSKVDTVIWVPSCTLGEILTLRCKTFSHSTSLPSRKLRSPVASHRLGSDSGDNAPVFPMYRTHLTLFSTWRARTRWPEMSPQKLTMHPRKETETPSVLFGFCHANKLLLSAGHPSHESSSPKWWT